MARQEFETVVAQAARKTIQAQTLTRNTPILAAGLETIYVYAPSGFVCNLNLLHLSVPSPAGSSSGTIDADLSMSLSASGANYIWGSGGFATGLAFVQHHWRSATVFKYPPTNEGAAIKAFWFDSSNGMRLNISNATNASTGAAYRDIIIHYTQEQVAG